MVSINLTANESLLRESRATHWKGFEGVGGKLFLTNRRVYFKSHFFNVQTHEQSISLQDIIRLEAKHSDFISSKLSIFLRDGSKEVFYIPKRKQWVEEMHRALEGGTP
jgi:hypothetical protein